MVVVCCIWFELYVLEVVYVSVGECVVLLVLNNLLDNVIKFFVFDLVVEICVFVEGGGVMLEVFDCGFGIVSGD